MVYGMVKTTVYLPDELKAALAQMAEETGRSEAELIREGIRLAVERRAPPEPTIGILVSADPLFAEHVDEYLAGIGTDQAEQDLHERRLAGPVLANQRVNLGRTQVEVHAVVGEHVTVLLHDLAHGNAGRLDRRRIGVLSQHAVLTAPNQVSEPRNIGVL